MCETYLINPKNHITLSNNNSFPFPRNLEKDLRDILMSKKESSIVTRE